MADDEVKKLAEAISQEETNIAELQNSLRQTEERLGQAKGRLASLQSQLAVAKADWYAVIEHKEEATRVLALAFDVAIPIGQRTAVMLEKCRVTEVHLRVWNTQFPDRYRTEVFPGPKEKKGFSYYEIALFMSREEAEAASVKKG